MIFFFRVGLCVALFYLSSLSTIAQGLISGFNDGDKVCFVGNSITTSGEFIHYIRQFYVTRFPDRRIDMINCGIPGDVAAGVLKRLKTDVFIHNPTHVVIMLGMNDVQRHLYYASPTRDQEVLDKREGALERYKEQLKIIVERCLENELEVILLTPSIYDQTADIPAENHLGVNDALAQCATIVKNMGLQYDLQVVDLWSKMNAINESVQQHDRTQTIIGKDRVHPGRTGHFIMAYTFLNFMEEGRSVSKIDSNKRDLKNGMVSYVLRPNSLPYPLGASERWALDLVPFRDSLGSDILKVDRIKRGTYELKVDEDLIGTFSAIQLNEGVDLSQYENPRMRQSLVVAAQLDQLKRQESQLRLIKQIEYNKCFGICDETFPSEKFDNTMDSLFREAYSERYYAYYKNRYAEYRLYKPNESQIISQRDSLLDLAYAEAEPKCVEILISGKHE